MRELPVEVKGKANGCDTELPSFEDNKEVDIFCQTILYFLHDILLRPQKIAHFLEAFFFGFNLQFATELVEVLEVKLHGTIFP